MQITIEQSNLLHEIIADTERRIKETLDLDLKLMVKEKPKNIGSPKEMLSVIAKALQLEASDYENTTRRQIFVDLRCIASVMLHKYYYELRLNDIANLVGVRDHSSVLNYMTRNRQFLDNEDITYSKKYNKAFKAVLDWING